MTDLRKSSTALYPVIRNGFAGKAFEAVAQFRAVKSNTRRSAREKIMDYVIRFLAGGIVVSLFAVVGDILRPKSFAGLRSRAAVACHAFARILEARRRLCRDRRAINDPRRVALADSFLGELLMRLRYSA